MAEAVKNKLYQVAIGSRWEFQFIQAENDEDLIRYLAKHHPDRTRIYGACEFRPDGSTRTAKIISHPLFEALYAENEARGIPADVPAGVAMIDGRPWAVMLPNREASEDRIGFRPVIAPLNRETLEPDSSFFLGREDGDVFCFGALYMDGVPVQNPAGPFWDPVSNEVPDYTPGAQLQIGNTSDNLKNRITWVKAGDKLIAGCDLLKNISWADLDAQGLAQGPKHLRARTSFEVVLADAQSRADTQNKVQPGVLRPDKER